MRIVGNKALNQLVQLKLFFAICLLFFVVSSSQAQLLKPKEVSVTVSNIPANQPSLFIPLSVSSEQLDLYRVDLKDVILRGYVASIEKDEEGRLLGLSFADIRSKALPETLTVSVRLRMKRGSSKEKVKSYPRSIQIKRAGAIAYSRPTKKIADALAGFNSLTFLSQDSQNIDELNKKKLIEERENKNKDFYVKSLGQTIVRGKRFKKKKRKVEYKQPFVRELSFFAVTPTDQKINRLYFPLIINSGDMDSLKITVMPTARKTDIVTRILAGNVIEVSNLDPEASLPLGTTINSKIKVEQRPDSYVEDLVIGPALSEPSESVAGVGVNIKPTSIQVGRGAFINPANIFKID